jgi:glycosyltransferase involved in cell wall biosynthesis
MKICFYAPFKPLNHSDPSGDLVIANSIYKFLSKQGHTLRLASSFRTRWIFWKPWLLPLFMRERKRVIRRFSRENTDLWFTYHTYYKGPDLLGPFVKRYVNIPYVIFQGVYSTKRKRKLRTWPGFVLNKKALLSARHVFTNKRVDYINLKRLLPSQRFTYVAPGIYPEDFYFDDKARKELHHQWQVNGEPVVLAAAMFRPGVKAAGLEWVIRACSKLFRQKRRFQLVIAGDGKEKFRLAKLAQDHLPGRVRFVGKVSREKMYRIYSAGDVFVFPGIGESLGMVFLEAQACGLPVVAFANAGVPEVVKDQTTGLLQPMYALDPFIRAIDLLLSNKDLRRKMGRAAQSYVRNEHDLNKNYRKMEEILMKIVN